MGFSIRKEKPEERKEMSDMIYFRMGEMFCAVKTKKLARNYSNDWGDCMGEWGNLEVLLYAEARAWRK